MSSTVRFGALSGVDALPVGWQALPHGHRVDVGDRAQANIFSRSQKKKGARPPDSGVLLVRGDLGHPSQAIHVDPRGAKLMDPISARKIYFEKTIFTITLLGAWAL